MTSHAFDLSGKTALVTGGSRGIGQAIAIGLAEAGADVIVVASRAENAADTVAAITKAGGKARALGCDQSDPAAIKATAEAAGSVDILINNAGTIRRSPARDFSDADWDAVISTNLTGVFQFCRAIGGKMLDQGHGKIINIASLLTFQGGITVPAYAASKGGVGQLTKALANEWAKDNVQVNAIAPGYIATDNTAALRADKDRNASILGRIPAGRWGDPKDLVGAAIFLSSSASDYVNGHILTVDGGWMAR
ncbi:2-dehydro-3-deoxy-D-gluconate 5-dehydrogenase KduD [Litorimonas sp. RW-G-Af-16]|uniref:2-dehydro-3-deoxy-D-gluconate 5-dehydrogenase KduD n=1 Tax=Litorimonas sp. RW-G-Af-16 TaxID=3241168 RepID=UPI00390C9B3B